MKKDSIKELVTVIYKAIAETKGINTVVLDIRQKATFADYLVIAGGSSDRQVKAIADRIQAEVKTKLHRHVLSEEGASHGVWVLLDYGDVVCHLFLDEVRSFYRLEDMWHDAKRVRLRASSGAAKKTKKAPTKAAEVQKKKKK